VVANKGLVVISRDKKMRTRPAERAAIMASGMRGIWITDSKNLSSWALMTRLVRHWDQMEAMITDLGEGPWMLALNSKGLTVTARLQGPSGGYAASDA
jgi:PIN like domain